MNTVEVNKNDYSLFQKYCESAIGSLNEECVKTFRETEDEESRIELLYNTATKIPVDLLEKNGKDFEIAQQEKIKGNSYFAKKDHKSALKCYNNGIIKCPQETGSDKELLTILISNRSATYFELGEYKRVFNDIDYLSEIGSYPVHLRYKIWLRKAKCYDALQNERLSCEAYDEALKCLNNSKLDGNTIKARIKEITNARLHKQNAVCKQLVPLELEDVEPFIGGKEYIAAHPKICFNQDDYQGRYAVATEDIGAGVIILEENPHCAVLDHDHALRNCQYCSTSVDQPIACPSCSNVIFCSTICERQANKNFHRIECSIQQSIFESGASVNCSLALRIISQKKFNYFNDKKNKLRIYLNDNCKKSIIKKKMYRFDDYDNLFFLCRNENLRKKEELIHYSCMAIYLLRLLKRVNYFPYQTKDNELTDDEKYIGSLLLRHLQLLQFNAHEVSELQNTSVPAVVKGFKTNYENATIGAGVYPTLALFNHSCDPSIVRYNVRNKIIVRTIKPVKAGDIVYENYGPLYMSMPLEKRQQVLKTNYWFECLCTPCTDLWPVFEDMNESELRISCKNERCPFIFVVRSEDNPFFRCKLCNTVTTIFAHLNGLTVLDEILPQAEQVYSLKHFEVAMNLFVQALEILFKYTKPPHPEIIKIQQRLRVCMIHLGNKACGYKIDV